MSSLYGFAKVYEGLSYEGQYTLDLPLFLGETNLVFLDGLLITSFSASGSSIYFDPPLPGGKSLVVYSGQGGSFVPTSYVEGLVSGLASRSELEAAVSPLLPLSGGNLTGYLSLHADPTEPMHPATKQYVDGFVSPEELSQELSSALADKPSRPEVESLLSSKMDLAMRGSPGGVAPLDDGGYLPAWSLPESVRIFDKNFFYAGPLAPDAPGSAGLWFPRAAGSIRGVVVSLGTPSSGGGVSLNVQKNGVRVLPENQVVVPEGEDYAEFQVGPPSVPFVRGDRIGIEIVSVGSTAPGEDLNVQLECVHAP